MLRESQVLSWRLLNNIAVRATAYAYKILNFTILSKIFMFDCYLTLFDFFLFCEALGFHIFFIFQCCLHLAKKQQSNFFKPWRGIIIANFKEAFVLGNSFWKYWIYACFKYSTWCNVANMVFNTANGCNKKHLLN